MDAEKSLVAVRHRAQWSWEKTTGGCGITLNRPLLRGTTTNHVDWTTTEFKMLRNQVRVLRLVSVVVSGKKKLLFHVVPGPSSAALNHILYTRTLQQVSEMVACLGDVKNAGGDL